MNREEFHTAISSFATGNGNLEVGIISRFPLTDIVEFDRSPDNQNSIIAEEKLERVNKPGIAPVGVCRGFLVAKVPVLNAFVIAVHMKSSRGRTGNSDRSNAQKRELVAAACAVHMVDLLEDNPNHSIIFGGDVNVGISDTNKNGTDLTDDRGDGYDDTHAILLNNLVTDDLELKSLVEGMDGTYVGNDNVPDFPGTGAIDVIYAAGPMSELLGKGVRASSRFGSDHLAVYTCTDCADGPSPPVGDSSDEVVSITNSIPNPEGPDDDNEVVFLRVEGNSEVDVSDWFMRDKAGNTFKFPSGKKLQPGVTQVKLNPNTMPLNNTGDTIYLFDNRNNQRGLEFTYEQNEVRLGEPIR